MIKIIIGKKNLIKNFTDVRGDVKSQKDSAEGFAKAIVDYAKDAELKIILVKQNIAAKHMDIGRFYLKNQKYIAAINRFKIVIEDYSETKFTPEALYRLVEIYYKIGMDEDAIKTAAVIAHNYPESKWYGLSYKLVGPKNKNTNILDKIKNLF